MQKNCILVVEDDPGIREAMKLALEMESYHVEVLDRAENITTVVQSLSPRCVLMDLLLAGENGSDAIQRMKSDPKTKHVPVILLSAHVNGPELAKAAGAAAFLEKPFDITALLSLVEKTIAQ